MTQVFVTQFGATHTYIWGLLPVNMFHYDVNNQHFRYNDYHTNHYLCYCYECEHRTGSFSPYLRASNSNPLLEQLHCSVNTFASSTR